MNTNQSVRKAADLLKPEVKAAVLAGVQQELNKGQLTVFAGDIFKQAEAIYDDVVGSYRNNSIEIPRMDLVQGQVDAFFTNFDLDTTNIHFQVLEKDIMVLDLKTLTTTTVRTRPTSKGQPLRLLVSELINYPEVDYDDNADLLHKLADQAIKAITETLPDEKQVVDVVFDYKS